MLPVLSGLSKQTIVSWWVNNRLLGLIGMMIRWWRMRYYPKASLKSQVEFLAVGFWWFVGQMDILAMFVTQGRMTPVPGWSPLPYGQRCLHRPREPGPRFLACRRRRDIPGRGCPCRTIGRGNRLLVGREGGGEGDREETVPSESIFVWQKLSIPQSVFECSSKEP